MDPWDFPEWHGFHRETSLAAGLVCAGANSIGRANYANLGEYYVAMFAFANGIERLGKLIWVADFRIKEGLSPTDDDLRRLGHQLPKIVNIVQDVQQENDLDVKYEYPHDDLTENVIDGLTMFADASRGRYGNFQTISSVSNPQDPLIYWWSTVVEPLLARHYVGTAREQRAARNAAEVERLLGDYSLVLHLDERQGRIDNLTQGSLRTAENEVAQTYGRFYVLRLVRWMSDVFYRLTEPVSGPTGDPTLFGHYELLQTFLVPDTYLRTRKRWPL